MNAVIHFATALVIPWAVAAEPVVVAPAGPPRRNVSVVYYDNDFLMLARDHGDHRDFGGNTKPGLFLHSKAHNRWVQIIKLSTKDGTFGSSDAIGPRASVGWDFRPYANEPHIEVPLKTSGSIAFPDRVEYDQKTARYKLEFFSSWEIEGAVTRLFVSRQDLLDAFEP